MKLTIPYQEHIEFYYSLFKQGLTDTEIRERFKKTYPDISNAKYKEFEPIFWSFTRLSIKEDSTKGIVKIPLTENLERKFLSLVRSGLPYDKAAKLLNIPLPTVTEYWFQIPYFKAKVDYAVELANSEVVLAMHKRATGFSKVLKSKTTTSNKEGEPIESITYREEYIVPSVEAGKFWLINKSPEEWSADGSKSKEGNKGKILEAIDGMTDLTSEDKKELGLEE